MGFSVGQIHGAKRVVMALDLGDGTSVRYAVTQLKRSEVITAQAEDRRQGDKASNAVLIDKIFSKTEPLDGAEDIREFSDTFGEDAYASFIQHAILLATTDPAKLALDGIEILPPKVEDSESESEESRIY